MSIMEARMGEVLSTLQTMLATVTPGPPPLPPPPLRTDGVSLSQMAMIGPSAPSSDATKPPQ